MAICFLPMAAQFTGGTTQVDPTVGAQTVAKYIVDGVFYCVAAVAFVCFCWGSFNSSGVGLLVGGPEILLRPRKGEILLKIFSKATAAGDDWFREVGDPSELFPITRFVSDEVFATRAGGYGASFAIDGIDTECLSDEAELAS